MRNAVLARPCSSPGQVDLEAQRSEQAVEKNAVLHAVATASIRQELCKDLVRIEGDVDLLCIVQGQVLVGQSGDVMDVQSRQIRSIQSRALLAPELLGQLNVIKIAIDLLRGQRRAHGEATM